MSSHLTQGEQHIQSQNLSSVLSMLQQHAYLTGVNAIIVLDRITTAVLCLVGLPFTQVVHTVPAARSGVETIQRNVCSSE